MVRSTSSRSFSNNREGPAAAGPFAYQKTEVQTALLPLHLRDSFSLFRVISVGAERCSWARTGIMAFCDARQMKTFLHGWQQTGHGGIPALPHNANPWQTCYNRAMNKQMSLSALSDELSQVRTKKREFLAEIDRIVPWGEWISLIRPCYYKGERGNKPYDLERMLRIYLVQNLYNLSDMATVAEVIDSRAFSDFCGVESSNQVPDGDTLGRFRNILLKNGIQQELFAQVVELLTQRGLILKRGTIVDSTFIEAPSSTKNQKKERDPEAHSAKKGNVWYFGYKAHIGVDSENGLVHTVQVTAANVHDVCVTADLLTGEEEQVYGDSGYLGAEKRPEARKKNTAGKKIRYKINRRPSQSKNNSARSQAQIKRREHEKSSVRAKVEHVFAVLKLQLRYRKTRYRGLQKQTAKVNILLALANLILADRPGLTA